MVLNPHIVVGMPTTPTAAQPLHQRVTEAKQAQKLTDRELARRFGISRDAMVKRRLGQTRFTAAEYPALAELLGATVAELMDVPTDTAVVSQ